MRLTNLLFNQNIKKASSLILLKPKLNTTEYEVLMLKRPKQGTFSGMTVFPGGAVDKADNEQSFQQLNTRSEIKEKPSELTQFKLSSIRETFEETGILITDKQPSLTQDELTKYRAEIINQPSEFINFLNKFNLTPQIDNLHAVSRWITPAYMKRRFDTVFFAHILNGEEQLASLNSSEGYQEAVQLNWETPKDWLLQQSSEEVDFMPPQFYFCQLLNSHLSTLKTLQDHLNYNNNAKLTSEGPMLEGYLPNHINIETSNVDLTPYNISLPPDYKLFYTILPGDFQYDKCPSSVPLNENEINGKFDNNFHRVLGIRNKSGHMKMLKLLTNLKVREGKFEFISSN